MAVPDHTPPCRVKRLGLFAVCLSLLLLCTGCGGQTLSKREIVHAILLERQGSGYSVCLLLDGQDAEKEGTTRKTAAAYGSTPAQALQNAEDALQGSAFYGLMDLLALPADTDWETAREIGELVYDKAQPAPELSVFLLPQGAAPHWAQDADALYERMKAIEENAHLHCGLQQLFVRDTVCTVPYLCTDGCYDFALLAKGAPQQRTTGLTACLAAVLARQTDRMQVTFAQGTVRLQTGAQITAEVNRVQLHLYNTEFTVLDGSTPYCAALLEKELQASFALLWRQTQTTQTDPFALDFTQACIYGPGARMQDPELLILWE